MLQQILFRLDDTDRMPPHYLWTGAAREAYCQMATAAAYGAVRDSGVVDLARGLRVGPGPGRVLLLGAGPDPRTELGVLRALAKPPGVVVVHDADDEASFQTASALALELVGDDAWDATRLCPAVGDLRRPYSIRPTADAAIDTLGLFDLATLCGYTVGNLTDDEAGAVLRDLAGLADRLLLDVPVAWGGGDPRRVARAFDPDSETAWLHAAYRAWRGVACETLYSDLRDLSDGYLVRIVTKREEEILRFRRRTASSWLGLFEASGWRLQQAVVSTGTPRLAALLVSE